MRGIVAPELSNGCSGTGGTPVAVGVDVIPGLCSPAESGLDFIADDHAFDEVSAIDSHLFSDGKGPGDGVNGGMTSSEPIAFVHFQGHASSGVGEGSKHGLGLEAVPEKGGRRGLGTF